MILAVKVFIPISSHVRKLKMTDSAENADPKTVRNLFQIVLPFINKNFIAAPLNDFNLLATIIIDQIRCFSGEKGKTLKYTSDVKIQLEIPLKKIITKHY